MKRCHVCERPCTREVEPAITGEDLSLPDNVIAMHADDRDLRELRRNILVPAVFEADVWTVVMGNGKHVDACHPCWMKWPWEHRLYPPTGFGAAA